MQIIQDLKVKIIKKEGQETELISLSTIAKVIGYSNSNPLIFKSYEIGIKPVRVGKKYKIRKKELERLLTAIITSSN